VKAFESDEASSGQAREGHPSLDWVQDDLDLPLQAIGRRRKKSGGNSTSRDLVRSSHCGRSSLVRSLTGYERAAATVAVARCPWDAAILSHAGESSTWSGGSRRVLALHPGEAPEHDHPPRVAGAAAPAWTRQSLAGDVKDVRDSSECKGEASRPHTRMGQNRRRCQFVGLRPA
jgi:hypothetical protein